MKKNRLHVLFLILSLIPSGAMGQAAEQNVGNNWVHPGALKFIGMDFTNSTTGTLINNGTVWYSGNFTNNGMVNYTSTLALTPALSQFAGDALQHISGSGTTRFYNLMFGSQLTPVAYSLEQDITVAHQVDFSRGILTTLQTSPETMMNILQLENGATSINASDNSYVDGFVSKTGNKAFIFPTGNRGFYRPVSIGAPGSAATCIAARYLYVNPDLAGYSRTNKASTLARVSDTEYWVVNRTKGSENGQITLSWDVTKTSAQIPNNLHTLVVARWDGSAWVNEGNTATTGDTTTGTVTATVTGYGIFTLANIITIPPVACNDTATTYEDVPLNVDLLANDSVFYGTTLILTDFSIGGIIYQSGTTATIPGIGTFSVASNGVCLFTPAFKYSGIVPAITYTIRDLDNNSDTGKLIINVLAMPELIKKASKPVMNNDGTFSWIYTLIVDNDTPNTLTNVQVEDNLDNVFNGEGCSYKITNLTATGRLTANGLYDGSGNVNLLTDGLSLLPNQQDTIRMEVKVNTYGQKDIISVFNQAVLTVTAPFGYISVKSDENPVTILLDPTETDIPVVNLVVTDGFSPNEDGINDKFIIAHEVSTIIDIEVFNRNGYSVYKSSDYQNDWNGKGMGSAFKGDLPEGTYYMSYKETKISSGEIVNKGIKFITLRR